MRNFKNNLVTLFASGFGSGLSPIAPGTMGSIVGVILYFIFLNHLSLFLYTLIIVIAFALGVYLCECALQKETHRDPPWIVWDEIVGMWITLWGVPPKLFWVSAGFILFRIFDILKPGPVRGCERYFQGGWGIMMDDVAAAIIACVIVHVALKVF